MDKINLIAMYSLIAFNIAFALYAFYAFRKRLKLLIMSREDLRILVIERDKLEKLKSEILSSFQTETSQAKASLSQMKKLAFEIEQELTELKDSSKAKISQEFKLIESSQELAVAKVHKERSLLKKDLAIIKSERLGLHRTLNKTEKLLSLLSSKVKPDEVLEEIRDSKYAEARALLVKGTDPEEVSLEVGLSLSEVNYLAEV